MEMTVKDKYKRRFDKTASYSYNRVNRLRSPGYNRWWNYYSNRKKSFILESPSLSYFSFSHYKDKSYWENKVVVDCGCGDSPDIDILTDYGAKATGIDLYPRNGRTRKGNFILGDIGDDWIDQGWFQKESVDVVLLNAVIDLLKPEERDLFYANAYINLKRGGMMVIYPVRLSMGYGFSVTEEVAKLKLIGFEVKKEFPNLLVCNKSSNSFFEDLLGNK